MKQIDFDDFIKNKLESKEYAFDEKTWISARAMLQAEKDRKRRRLVVWFFMLSMAVLGFYIILYPSNSTPNEEIVEHGSQIEKTSTEHKRSDATLLSDNKMKESNLESSENQISSIENNGLTRKKPISRSTKVDGGKITKAIGSKSNPSLAIEDKDATPSLSLITAQRKQTLTLLSNASVLPIQKLVHSRKRAIIKDEIVRDIPEEMPFSPYLISSLHLGVGKESSHVLSSISYAKPIASDFEYEIGLRYHYARSVDLPSHRGNLANYNSLQRFFYQSSIEADQFHFVGSFVKLHWNMNRLHSFSAGLYAERLVLTRGTIRKEHEDPRSTWIVETGLNRNHLGTEMGYSFTLTDRWKVNFLSRWDMTNVFSEGIPVSGNLSHLALGSSYSF